MQHDTTAATQAATVAGIDWATDTNALCIIDHTGRVLARLTAPATAAGLARLTIELDRYHVTHIAIERPDGPVVDALLASGRTVVVITPRQVHHLRARYAAAGNKTDRFDAYVLADVLRTDRGRLRPLHPNTPQTMALRAAVRARTDLVEARVALCNQLRAHLRAVFPAAVGLFANLDSPISLAFLARFPSAQAANWLTTRRLQAWLAANHYCGRTPARVLLARVQAGPAGLTGDPGQAATHVTGAYVASLRAVRDQIAALEAHIAEQLALHPDAPIFRSLPRSGRIRAAKLLVEIGDARGRFPTEASLAALAGAAPSTRQSGRYQQVVFRWACDKRLREAVMDFAADSRHASAWAAGIYDRHRAAGKTHQHATRILARAWLRVIWRCWQTHSPYNPALHGIRRQRLLPLAA